MPPNSIFGNFDPFGDRQRTTASPAASNPNTSNPNRGGGSYIFPVEGYQGDIPAHHGSHAGGADIFAAPGTPVRAMRAGTVLNASFDAQYGGNNVLIQGDDGNVYYYAHLIETPSVRTGQTVSAGDYIGGVGETGNARGTGAHLHIGIGPTINNGGGPGGGAGANFDATTLLRNTQAGTANNNTSSPPSTSAPRPQGQGINSQWSPMVRAAAQRHGVDPDLFDRQLFQESGYSDDVIYGRRRSSAGAAGIGQFMPSHYSQGQFDPFNPEQATDASARLMASHLARYNGDYRRALIAYNAGPGRADLSDDQLPEETRRYLQIIMGNNPMPQQSGQRNQGGQSLFANSMFAGANAPRGPRSIFGGTSNVKPPNAPRSVFSMFT